MLPIKVSLIVPKPGTALSNGPEIPIINFVGDAVAELHLFYGFLGVRFLVNQIVFDKELQGFAITDPANLVQTGIFSRKGLVINLDETRRERCEVL